MSNPAKPRGFTLIEILVVITIIAVLIAAGMASYTNLSKKSRDARRKSDMGQIQQALEMYRSDNLQYPSCSGTASCLATVVAPAAFSSYLSTIPSDPQAASGYTYQYTSVAPNTSYCLTAFTEADTAVTWPSSCAVVAGPAGSFQYTVKNP